MSWRLFSKDVFPTYATNRRNQLIQAVQGCDMTRVLSMDEADLIDSFLSEYEMSVPTFHFSEIYLLDSPREVSETVQQPNPVWEDETINVNQSRIQFTVCVPFEGVGDALIYKPSSYKHILGRTTTGTIERKEIRFSYNEISSDQNSNLNQLYQQDVDLLKTNISNLGADIKRFNDSLRPLIIDALAKRRASAEKSKSAIGSLDIPIKKREDIPQTYNIPVITKRPRIETKKSKSSTFRPEPTLATPDYENILSIVKDMSLAMERSPKTFAKLSEEEIRDFFLILLNGHYKGTATGETFNGKGKTDILVRHEGENAFIAECKFWKGQKIMSQTIDQLLGYVTWRDTKTAIFLFNKKGNLTDIVEKSVKSIREHPSFKSKFNFKLQDLEDSETAHGFKIAHPSDEGKEAYLTLMAFQVSQND